MIGRLGIAKTVLWAAVGMLAVATAARFTQGLGATTNLSDAAPWGLWIAFDVMAGVALAAGGFVLAATVYIFGLERYRPFVRPAVLTAFLGYVAVATGLLYDLGLPWHIWHPMVFPQHHSVLFEVAMCVMLYLTVLALEFAPVALEHPLFSHPLLQRIHAMVKRVTILLVIAGIVLSTLHQSSLGSLFLIAPHRVHALWYSPIVYVLFFTSAIALGLMVVIMESLLSAFFFGHKIRTDLLSRLGAAAAMLLGLYTMIRLGDLAWRGVLGAAFDGSWQGFLFLFELLLSAVVPAVLLAMPQIRQRASGLATAASMTILGMVLYRFDICIIAFTRPEHAPYWPSWIEVAVSAGIVSAAALVFIFFVEHLKVYSSHDAEAPAAPSKPSYDPASMQNPAPASLAAARRHSLAFVLAAALTFGLLPDEARFGATPERTPVMAARRVEGIKQAPDGGKDGAFLLAALASDTQGPAETTALWMIDGNRDGRFVLFPHDRHVEEFDGQASCKLCHHQNLPFDQNSSCHECHRDMYETTDIFGHPFHVKKLGGNDGCVLCHKDTAAPKSRKTAASCTTCHADMPMAGSRVLPADGGSTGHAPGYMEVMHKLCVDCHKEKKEAEPQAFSLTFGRCDGCHGIMDSSNLDTLGPYATAALPSHGGRGAP